MKEKPREQDRIYASYTSNNRLICRIHKKISENRVKKTYYPTKKKNWAYDRNRNLPIRERKTAKKYPQIAFIILSN